MSQPARPRIAVAASFLGIAMLVAASPRVSADTPAATSAAPRQPAAFTETQPAPATGQSAMPAAVAQGAQAQAHAAPSAGQPTTPAAVAQGAKAQATAVAGQPTMPAAAAQAAAAVPSAAASTGAAAGHTYKVDRVHSTVGFSIRHLVSTMSGNFRDFEGTLTVDPKNLATTQGTFVVKTTSIDTANEKRDGHLRSADFFDVEKYPEIDMKISSVEPTGAGSAKVTADFTMRGVTKPVQFDVKDVAFGEMGGSNLMGFTATATVDRTDYGMIWNKVFDAGGVALGNDVTIRIAVEARAVPPAPPQGSGE